MVGVHQDFARCFHFFLTPGGGGTSSNGRISFSSCREDFPRVSRLRKNLTALSQHHNLYFVAYRSWIHVYVPGRGGDLVTGRPLAILNPALSRTPVSAWTPGHIEPAHPESVNHLHVGDFGDKEILLAARDNGDVVAWYTDTIARAVEQRRELLARREDEECRPPEPRHFFAECVGNSAWGLAIHSRDRLIAVSSNNKEVTVFAFALSGDEADAQFEDYNKPHDPVAAEGAVVGEGASRWAFGTDPKSVQPSLLFRLQEAEAEAFRRVTISP